MVPQNSKYDNRFSPEEKQKIREELFNGLRISELQTRYGLRSYDKAVEFAAKLTGIQDISIRNANRPDTSRDAAALLAVEIIRLVVEMNERIKSLEGEIQNRDNHDQDKDIKLRMSLESLRQIMQEQRN